MAYKSFRLTGVANEIAEVRKIERQPQSDFPPLTLRIPTDAITRVIRQQLPFGIVPIGILTSFRTAL
jgi:hypothetical protein